MEKLVREKQIGDAQGLVMNDSISDKQADNVSLPEKSLCNLNEKAPDPAIEHGASLTPIHVGGVLLAQIQDDDLCKLKDTVTDDASLQGITVPCSFVQVSQPDESLLRQKETVPCTSVNIPLQGEYLVKQIETEPNHAITHGASNPPALVGGVLQARKEADSSVKLTDTGSDDALIPARTVPYTTVTPAKVGEATQALKLKDTVTVIATADAADVIRSRCEKAAQVGIDVNTNMARRMLCNLSIPIEDAILRLSPELTVLLRQKRFTGNYSTEGVELGDHGYREFTREGGKDNDDDDSHSDDDVDITAQGAKQETETNSEDSDVDVANANDDSEKVCATTMLAFAAPKQPTTDPI